MPNPATWRATPCRSAFPSSLFVAYNRRFQCQEAVSSIRTSRSSYFVYFHRSGRQRTDWRVDLPFRRPPLQDQMATVYINT